MLSFEMHDPLFAREIALTSALVALSLPAFIVWPLALASSEGDSSMSRVPFAKAGPRQASVPPGPGDRASSGSRPPLARKRSDSPGFFSIVGLAQPTLHIALSEEVLFLHPTPKDEPAQDPVLQGT